MASFLQSFFVWLGIAPERDLIRTIEFLRAENRMLRQRLSKQVRLTQRERQRLIRLGRRLGPAIRVLISVVSPATFARWLRAPMRPRSKPRCGRPRTPKAIRAIVVRIGQETGWGVTRIHGELRKLGIHSVSRSTVRNILRESGIEPRPKNDPGSWRAFVSRHLGSLWACDFFSVRIWTWLGRKEVFVLFFIHLATRRVFVSGLSKNPTPGWVVSQVDALGRFLNRHRLSAQFLLHDQDSKFGEAFGRALAQRGCRAIRLSRCAPNLNAVAERWVQSVRRECLNQFIICGEKHLEYLLSMYLEYYHRRRPHQSLHNMPILDQRRRIWRGPIRVPAVACQLWLGGLLRHYYRKAG